MPLIFLTESEDAIKLVGSIHYQPNLLDDKTKSLGIEVDENTIPNTEPITGKDILLKYDTNNNEFLVEYRDRPLTPNEKIQQQEQMIADLTFQLMMKGVL